jgi:DNA processing protein
LDNLLELHKIAAAHLYGIKKSSLNKLMNKVGSLESIFTTPIVRLSQQTGISENRLRSMKREKALERAQCIHNFNKRHGISHLFYQESNYPFQLKECKDGPISLNILGQLNLKNRKIVAMVGTRKCSHFAKEIVDEIIASFKGEDIVVLSGLALGVDTHIHESCLKHNVPTAAILGHGLQMIYPQENRQTAKRIIDSGGALISEFDYRKKPSKYTFPQRNRIIAGMADITVVIESAMKGGSMITAELANGYSRDVMACPNSMINKSFGGCNELIKKNKAHLLADANDLFELMNWNKKSEVILDFDLTREETSIVNSIQQKQEIHINEIIQNTNLSAAKVQSTLMQLELKNFIFSAPNLYYSSKI